MDWDYNAMRWPNPMVKSNRPSAFDTTHMLINYDNLAIDLLFMNGRAGLAHYTI